MRLICAHFPDLLMRLACSYPSVPLLLLADYSNMPEMRDSKRTALGELSGGGGFFIRRVASPGALAARGPGKPLARRFIRPSNNKENVPPVWAVKATATKRRSPLPDWYPRTPLRDITAIAKVIESFFQIMIWIMQYK